MNDLKALFNILLTPSIQDEQPDYTPTFARSKWQLPIATFAPTQQDNPNDWYQDILGKWHRKPGSGPNF